MWEENAFDGQEWNQRPSRHYASKVNIPDHEMAKEQVNVFISKSPG